MAIHVAERAGGVQARNRVAARIDDVGVLVAASTADGIADARVQRNGVERTGLDLCQLLAAEVLVSALVAQLVPAGNGGLQLLSVHLVVPFAGGDVGGQLVQGGAGGNPATLELPFVVGRPSGPATEFGIETLGHVADAHATVLGGRAADHAAPGAAVEGGLIEDVPRGNTVEIADLLIEIGVGLPATMGAEDFLVTPAFA